MAACLCPLVLAWLAGCQSGPSGRSPVTTAYFGAPAHGPARGVSNSPPAEASQATVTVAVTEPLVVVPAAPLALPPEPAPAAGAVSPSGISDPPSLPGEILWPSNWVNAWIALESWGRLNGLSKPRQLTSGQQAVYELETTNGPMTVRVGNQAVRFDGAEFWLGFAPKLIGGLPYVHSLDARKTLQPLLAQTLRLPSSPRVVVIDPGHGGKDSGARSSFNGDFEKIYTLDTARRLQRLLLARGWTAILTRSNDTFITLGDRVNAAERARADLFVSIHFNSGSGSGEQSGVETYCLTPNGLPSNLFRDEGDDPRQMHPNNAFDEQNLQFAVRVHRSMLAATEAADRGVRRARFMSVLRGQTRPAVLVEAGFLTNPEEARKVATPEYRQIIAEGLAKALE